MTTVYVIWYGLPVIIILLTITMLSLIYHYWNDHHYLIINWDKLFSDTVNTAATVFVKALVTYRYLSKAYPIHERC